jgi:NAD(P)H dehydrogenase (quinone)
MPKVLVLFHSRTGNTAALADAVAEGAESVKFTEVEMRRIEDLAPASVIGADDSWKTARAALARKYRPLESVESLARYDALIIGSPARDGEVSAELKAILDEAKPLQQQGVLADKVGSVFGSGLMLPGGDESSVVPMLIAMMRLGMILVPPDCSDASATVATANGEPSAAALCIARQQGARVAKVAEWVRHAKSHEAHGHKH